MSFVTCTGITVPSQPALLMTTDCMATAEPGASRILRSPGQILRDEVVVRGGVEPPTFRFSGGRSYQLSYLTSTGPWAPGSGADPSGPDGI